MTTLLYIDDNAPRRDYFTELFRRSPLSQKLELITDSGDMWREILPRADFVVSDVGLPGTTGFEVIRVFRTMKPDGGVILLSSCPLYPNEVLLDSVTFYCGKDAPQQILVRLAEIFTIEDQE